MEHLVQSAVQRYAMFLSFFSPSRFNALMPLNLLLALIYTVSFHSIVLQEKVLPALSLRKLLPTHLGTRRKVSKGLRLCKFSGFQIHAFGTLCSSEISLGTLIQTR